MQDYLLTYPNLDCPQGRVVLDNDLVVLQRLVVPPHTWEGIHSHPGNQLYVHIRGGEWSGRLAGEAEYTAVDSPDGEVGWLDAIPMSAGHDSGNTGDTPIDLIYVTLKRNSPLGSGDDSPPKFADLDAPMAFENERLFVQRLQFESGQWTGMHRYAGNQIGIFVKGGTWTVEHEDGARSACNKADGDARWIDAGAVRNCGNAGDAVIEWILVTLR